MKISIEVVYALPNEQVVVPLVVSQPVRIQQAIEQSGLLERFPEITLSDDTVGIFAYRLPLDHLVEDGDRIEIYRPLQMSPTEARRIRAATKDRKTRNA